MLHVTIDVLYNFEAMSASKEGNTYLGFQKIYRMFVFTYFNFPIFSNIWFERFSSLEWKTTEKVLILKGKSLTFILFYQANWFLEQEDNSILERTTIEEQSSSESWSFVT